MIFFNTVTVQEILTYFKAHMMEFHKRIDEDAVEENRLYIAGDHWQDGSGYIGPVPTSEDGASTWIRDTMNETERAFVSENLINEILRREEAAILGREPVWGFTLKRPLKKRPEPEQPTEVEQSLIDEATALLTTWWDLREPLKILREAIIKSRSETRVVFRVFLPVVEDEKGNRVIPKLSLEDWMSEIYIDSPDNDLACVYEDPQSKQRLGIFEYEYNIIDATGVERTQKKIELSFIQGDETIHQVIDYSLAKPIADNEGIGNEPRGAYRLDKHMLMFEIQVPLLITESVKSNQRLFNFAMTMATRGVASAGFRERIGFNIDMPGEEKQDETGRLRFFPDPFQTGPNTFNVLQGTEVTGPDGATTRLTPAYQVVDPAPVSSFNDTKEMARVNILHETDQMFTLIAGDAVTSGVSRQQATALFEQRTQPVVNEIAKAGRWMLETVLHFAAFLSGQPERFKSLRAMFECKFDTGPLTADQATTATTLKGTLWSRDRAMQYVGVDDPAAEQAAIDAEPQNAAAITNVQTDAQIKQLNLQRAQRFTQAMGEPPNTPPTPPNTPPTPPSNGAVQ